MASSSAIQPKEKYDVFISFRGRDTRKTFTSHLHAALVRWKIDTYIDNRLERGHEIETSLLTAIEKSKICVIIFSENYASSKWCLDELAYIVECKERNGVQFVIPIFYEVDPSHVRRQRGRYELEERFQDKTETQHFNKWKGALTKAADLSGFDSKSSTYR